MKSSTFARGILGLLLVAAVAACDDSTGVGSTTSLQVLLTDAPSDYIDSAMVDIGSVELLGGAGGPVILSEDGTDGPINLLDLTGAATAALASADIPAGSYAQLRLVIESASVELAEGYEFNDGTTGAELTVPSGAQTGIKLNLSAGDAEGTEGTVEIAPGEMVLVVDFDVSQSFVLQGSPDTPAGISSVSFQPTLRVVVDDVAASISGTVSTALAEVSVEGLVVTAEPVDGTTLEPFQTEAATAVTAEDGSYTIYFLVPGDYEVTVDPGAPELAVAPEMETVTVGPSEDVVGVDFEVVAGG